MIFSQGELLSIFTVLNVPVLLRKLKQLTKFLFFFSQHDHIQQTTTKKYRLITD